MRRIRESVLDFLEYLGRGAALGERPNEKKPSGESGPLIPREPVMEPCHRSAGGRTSSSGFRILM